MTDTPADTTPVEDQEPTDQTDTNEHGRPVADPDQAADNNPSDSDEPATRAGRRQHRDAEKYRGLLREVEAERDALRQQIAELHRAEVARETGVPEADITGDTIDAMRESAVAFNARIAAELARRGISAAAPASMVSFGAQSPQVDSGTEFIDAFRPPR